MSEPSFSWAQLAQLWQELQARKIQLRLEGDNLRLQAPRGAMNADLQAGLRQYKAALTEQIRYLQAGPERLPLSPVQERLWFLQQLEPRSARYHETVVLKFSPPSDLLLFEQRLRASLQTLCLRHQALRASFFQAEGQLWQTLLPPLPSLSTETSVDAEDYLAPLFRFQVPQATLQDEIDAFMTRPFELEQAPLFRIGLFAAQELYWVGVFHHLICDAWSAALLLQEWRQLFQGQSLPPLAQTYRDYVRTLPTGPTAPTVAKSLERVLPTLAELPLELDLPRQKPSETHVPDRADSCRLHVSERLQALWQERAASTQLTRFAWLLSTWQAFLKRYWSLPDYFLATPVTGRRTAAEESLVGCLIETLLWPVRQSNSLDLTAEGAARTTQAQLLEQLDQPLPFVALVKALNPPRNLPFFPQLCVVMQDFVQELPELHWQRSPFAPAKFELLFSWLGLTQELQLEWPQGWFSERQMQQLLHDFVDFWEAALTQPEAGLAQLPLFRAERRAALLASGRPRQNLAQMSEPPPTETILTRISAWAHQRPEAPALVLGERRLTYADLEAQSTALAQILRRRGLQRGQVVAVWCRIEPELPLLLLAILKLGAAYLPLDEDLPPLRRAAILQDAQVTLWVHDRSAETVQMELSELSERPDLTPVTLSELLQALPQHGLEGGVERLEGPPVLPSERAYIIYTSGSTGQPNGVPIQHAQLLRLFVATAQEFDFRPDDAWLLFHSLAFDFSVWELWGGLFYGACVHLLPRSELKNPERVWQYVVAAGIQILNQTPSAFRGLTEARQRLTRLPSHRLRLVLLSGEKLEFRHLQPWYALEQAPTQLVNAYGITETTVLVSWRNLSAEDAAREDSPMGLPLADLGLLLLNAAGEPVAEGQPGELCVLGAGLSQGYLHRPELTAQRFVLCPVAAELGLPADTRMYRSGDRALYREGEFFYLGRADQQVKIRGYRIECGEIQAALEALPEIQAAAVQVKSIQSRPQILAYVVPAQSAEPGALTRSALRARLKTRLSAPMLPDQILTLAALPLNQNGKIDYRALPDPPTLSPVSPPEPAEASAELLSRLQHLFAELLQVPVNTVDPDANFFELGAHSLLLVEARNRLEAELGQSLELLELFQHPSLRSLAAHLRAESKQTEPSQTDPVTPTRLPQPLSQAAPIAIIGMALRLPGAQSPEEFARNLRQGHSAVRFWTEAELAAAGVPEAEYRAPEYVPASAWCEGVHDFAHDFFRVSPAEAALLDPQQRLMLELAYEALDNAGYGRLPGQADALSAGVFASAGISRYLLWHLHQQSPQMQAWSPMQWLIANDKDYLATRVAYKLNLTGPAQMVQSACSSSLLAVHQACESLRRGESELALAGGVNLDLFPQGYRYQEGGIYSRDGHCRPFSAQASGIVGGSGGAWVVLKPLAAAQRDGDFVYAVIEASAVNNDGAQKVGYLAPGLRGQTQVVRKALLRAGLAPSQMACLEAHGTGTRIGDPIEVQALQQAWRSLETLPQQAFCALGSVKGNIGHLDAAAGIASLIKVALMLQEGQIYPTLYAERPNPALKLEISPFYLARSAPWPGPDWRAAVSALGVGGTNVHMILRQAELRCTQSAPQNSARVPAALAPQTKLQLWLLSAPDQTCFKDHCQALGQFLNPPLNAKPLTPPFLERVATALQRRPALNWRGHLLVSAEASERERAQALEAALRSLNGQQAQPESGRLWLCPGLGAQQAHQAPLYAACPPYREALEELLTTLASEQAQTLRSALLDKTSGAALQAPRLMQPLIFLQGWALAQAYLHMGLRPAALMGHSFGEYLAACLGGLCRPAEMLPLVLKRAEIFAALPPGGVLALALSEAEVRRLLHEAPVSEREAFAALELAVINGAERCSLAGPEAAVQAFQRWLVTLGLAERCRRLPVAHYVHHSRLQECSRELLQVAAEIDWQAPQIPVWSGLAQDWFQGPPTPEYWAEQILQPLDFRPALQAALKGEIPAGRGAGRHWNGSLELGFQPQLTGLLRQAARPDVSATPEGPDFSRLAVHSEEPWRGFLQILGQAWSQGAALNLDVLSSGPFGPLPATPLPRRHFPLPTRSASQAEVSGPSGPLQRLPESRWYESPRWQSLPPGPRLGALSSLSAEPLLLLGFEQIQAPALLTENEALPAWLGLNLWEVPGPQTQSELMTVLAAVHDFLRHLSQRDWRGQVCLLTPPLFPVTGQEAQLSPLLAAFLGMVQAAEEWPFELCLLESDAHEREAFARVETWASALLQAELTLNPKSSWHLARRQGLRWESSWQSLNPIQVDKTREPEPIPGLCVGGVYLITGAAGGLGQSFATYLQARYDARLFLLGRSAAPDWLSPEQRWFQGDVSDPEFCQRVLQALALQTQGRLDGVIHAAGTVGAGRLADLAVADWNAALAAKVQGSLNLQAALQQEALKPRFVLLCSAFSTRFKAPGQAAYMAANAVLNALAQSWGEPWLAVNWGTWGEAGMAQALMNELQAKLPPGLEAPFVSAYAAYLRAGLSREEGCRALETSLRLADDWGLQQLSVSPLSVESVQTLLRQSLRLAEQGARTPLRKDSAALQESAADVTAALQAGDIASALQEIWGAVLGQQPQPEQRFSELGGDSLMILQVRQALSALPEGPPPLDLLLLDLPLRELAQRLALAASDASENLSSLLVPLNRRPASQERPLYFVHAISGTVFPFWPLAEALPFPFYGLQSRGLGRAAPHDDIPTMAAAYGRAIMAEQAPPYRLGGWSFGALVAFEMVRWFQAQGVPVTELILLDMQAPDSLLGLQGDEAALRERFEADLAALDRQQYQHRQGGGRQESLASQELKTQLFAIFQAHVQASRRFRAERLHVPSTLLVAESGFGRERPEPDLGWGAYLPDLTVHRIPGDHYSCLDVQNLAQWVHLLIPASRLS